MCRKWRFLLWPSGSFHPNRPKARLSALVQFPSQNVTKLVVFKLCKNQSCDVASYTHKSLSHQKKDISVEEHFSQGTFLLSIVFVFPHYHLNLGKPEEFFWSGALWNCKSSPAEQHWQGHLFHFTLKGNLKQNPNKVPKTPLYEYLCAGIILAQKWMGLTKLRIN